MQTSTSEMARLGALASRGFFAGSLLFVFTGISNAQQAANPEVVLETIQVDGESEKKGPQQKAGGPVDGFVATRSATGTKSDAPLIEQSQSISVVTSDQMESRDVKTLGEALRYTPGVALETQADDPRGNGIQMRGFNVNDEVFYRDGLRLSGAGFAGFMGLDTYGAENIEVLKGPASVLYGQITPGGLINYVSKKPTDRAFAEIGASVGTYDRYEGIFDFGGPINEDETLLYRVTGLLRDSGTEFDDIPDDRVFIAPAFTWQNHEGTTLTVLANYQYEETGWTNQYLHGAGVLYPLLGQYLPRDIYVGDKDWDKFVTEQASLGYLFEHVTDSVWTFRQNFRIAAMENDQRGLFIAGIDLTTGDLGRYSDWGLSDYMGFAIDNQAQADFGTGPIEHKLVMGLDYRYAHADDWGASGGADSINLLNPTPTNWTVPNVVYNDLHTEQSHIGLYAIDQMSIGNWRLSLGGRQDFANSMSQEKAPGSASYYDVDDEALTGRAGLLYAFDNGVSPYVQYSESFLPVAPDGQIFRPETAEQYEAGVKYQPLGTNALFTLAAFHIVQDGTVIEVLNVMRQLGETTSQGVEVEAVVSTDWGLDIQAGYAYTDAEYTDPADPDYGLTPYTVAEHRAAVWADYTIQTGQLENLGFGAGVRYVGETFDGKNTTTIPAFTLVDAAVHYEYKGARFAINVTNLFDEKYVVGCYDPEWSCYMGDGRKATASLIYRW